MRDPLQFTYIQGDGSARKVIAAPVDLENDATGNSSFKIYKDAVDDDTTLFTDGSLAGAENNDIDDQDNPDYLGTIVINQAGKWEYTGDILNKREQQQIAENLITSE